MYLYTIRTAQGEVVILSPNMRKAIKAVHDFAEEFELCIVSVKRVAVSI